MIELCKGLKGLIVVLPGDILQPGTDSLKKRKTTCFPFGKQVVLKMLGTNYV